MASNIGILKQLREALNMLQDEFARNLGYSQAAISSYERGVKKMSDKFIRKVIRTFPQVNITFLKTGDGEMFIPVPNPLHNMDLKIYAGRDVKKGSITVNKNLPDCMKELELTMKENESLRREIESMTRLIDIQDKAIIYLQAEIEELKKKLCKNT